MRKMIISRLLSGVICSAMLLSSACVNDYSNISILSAQTAADKIQPFSLGDVTMLDPYCTNAFSLELSYLLKFDTNKLLAGFRDNAGLNTYGATRYDGWENSLIGGHCVGHYLSALAQAYCNPSLTDSQRKEVLSKISTLVDNMKICQQNSKGKPGFLWAAKKADASNVEAEFDNIENGKTNIITEAWVPWYTMHKLIAGLNDVYDLTGYSPAKDVASSLGDWVYNRCSRWSSSTHSRVLGVEYGGMNDCLYELYNITSKETHAVAAHYFDETALHERVLAGGSNVLNNQHANTTIPKFLGALKRYTILDGKTIEGQKVDASRYLQYAEAFWDMVTTHHTYITGGNSEWEHFGLDDVLDKERTNCNCETCNSYNMLKLSRELFEITGDSKYMDYYETTYYNSILSSQNPQTGMTTYFQPMATGYFKVYSSPFNNFWCCTGSGMENFTKLGDTIYMKKDNTLYVNLYQSSVLDWQEQNVKIKQDSSIPDGDTSSFTVEGDAQLDLRFRIPSWIAGNMIITLNGQRYSYKTVNGYAQVQESFKNGDVIRLTIPEEVQACSLPDSQDVYGFRYGPVVLSAQLGSENMKQGTTGMNVSIPADQIVSTQKINIKDQKTSVSSFMSNINDYLVRDTDKLQFSLTGTDVPLTFTPHYRQYEQRYGIYWYFYSQGAANEEAPRAKTTVTDTVQPGYGQYENDDLHAMDETGSVSVTSDSTYRYATGGGYFSYRMAVDETAPLTILQMTLRKSDNGKTIRICIGDTILYRKTLDYSGNDDTYSVKIIIPSDIISEYIKTVEANSQTYDVVDVRFSSDNSDESAKICDFIYMTAVKPVYSYDAQTAYFVDCGDHNTTTATGSDKFGFYNSHTEQLYGEDPVTGAYWGLIDSSEDQYGGSSKSKALYTANTWPDEYNTADGQDKSKSFRYTKNQYENDISRHIDYGFTLPNGTYSVEIGFCDPWSCSGSPSVYADYDTANQQLIADKYDAAGKTPLKGNVNVSDGYMTLNFRSDSKAINVSYIIIRVLQTDPYELTEIRGDVNLDHTVSVSDAAMLQRYLLGKTDLTQEQIQTADMNYDNKINIIDFILLKKTLLAV
ncbi:MAG: glycoside hydrolase family 127 protein [Oscillospiraceae bacterium]|nr:glycoside hydrolase family 127 protein [Oscillospiraceae bacterium]